MKKLLDYYKQKTLVGLLVHLATAGVLVGAVILIFFFVYLPSYTNKDESVTVPNLEGLHMDKLDEYLTMRNLRFEVSDSGYSSVYPPLTVLKQYPEAGAYVKEGRKIYLTVKARVPQSVKMPNLKDGSLKNAELVLKSYGLKRGSISYIPDLAQNAVLRQLYEGKDIEPGILIPKGSTVDLIVGDGLGNKTFRTPTYISLSMDDAKLAVVSHGLRVGTVIFQVVSEEDLIIFENLEGDEDDTTQITKSGLVFKQNPSPDETIHLGEQVDLWISCLDDKDSIRLTEEWLKHKKEENDDQDF